MGASQHRNRSRVIQRLIEICPGTETVEIVEEIICNAAMLSKHSFGNYIIQSLLEHGSAEDKERLITTTIIPNALKFAKHKFACNVVRVALMYSPSKQKQQLLGSLSADAKQLSNLVHHCFGSFVARDVKAALEEMKSTCK